MNKPLICTAALMSAALVAGAAVDADIKGEVMSAAKASIREEILFEIINELNKIEKAD